MDLIKKNITGEKLSKRLGVSDWREKINGAADFHEALSRRSDLWDIIRKLQDQSEKEFICASCGQKKEEYYKYPLEGGKKYCSAECWNKGEGKDDSPANRGRKFEHFSVSDFFTLMKKMNAKEIRFDFSTNQIVVEFNNGQSKQLDSVSSGLSSEQKQKLASELKSSQQPITFSQVSQELEKGKNKKGDNAGIIGAIVVVGIILAVVIGVVVHKSRKKDY